MATTLKAVVRYNGADFAGWQVQPGQRTIQGVIEEALATIAGEPVRIAGAGRTDSGVHALGQVFSCHWPGAAGADALRRSLSQMLGPEIRIESIDAVPDDFHASYSSTGKRYAYAVSQSKEPDPFLSPYVWTVPWDIDWEVAESLIRRVVGEHDFAGFASSGSSVETTVRTLYSATIESGPVVGPGDAKGTRHIELRGSGFLYKMVRNIVGTVIEVARGRLEVEAFEERLAAPAPYHGYTAPPQGLFLVNVEY